MRLLFMPDYLADPLGDLDSEGMIDLDQLPIDVALRARTRSWAAEYTERGQTSGWADPFAGPEGVALRTAGHALWLELRTVLAPAHEVGYVSFPDDTRHVQWHPGGPLEPCPPRPQVAGD